uniref:Uncharacterized protein n=1 Tax=Anguilla anguilla TaxID=7936 RepID=A0A0E9TL36_ANGAN
MNVNSLRNGNKFSLNSFTEFSFYKSLDHDNGRYGSLYFCQRYC